MRHDHVVPDLRRASFVNDHIRPRLVTLARGALHSAASAPFSRRVIRRLAGELNLAIPTVPDSPPTHEIAATPLHTTLIVTPLATPRHPVLPKLNSLCAIEDWENPAFVQTVRHLLPAFVAAFHDFPTHQLHRKHWEAARVLLGLEQLGVVHESATILSVGAGHEGLAYDLSTKVRWIFITDIYGGGPFKSMESDARMLIDPGYFAPCSFNRNRMIVQYMNGLDLRHEPNTFDAVYSLSSIEHFGGFRKSAQALAEMHRVVKPGGTVAITTECVVNGAPAYSESGLDLFTPEALLDLINSVPGLVPIDDLTFVLSDATLASRKLALKYARREAVRGREVYPHILLEHKGRVFTSVALFWRKSENG